MRLPKFVDFRNDLFATIFSFGAQAVIRLGSSLVLTRVLKPEAYGIIAILMSLLFVVEMLADIGVGTYVLRDKDAEIPDHFRTAWTIRFFRSMLNFVVVCGGAEVIAVHIYHLPDLVVPLRVFSLWYILVAFESMAYPIAIRRKQARISQYCELAATFVSTIFTVIYCLNWHTYWGMLWGILLKTAISTFLSWQFFKDLRPGFAWNPAVAKEIFKLTRYTTPSGLMSLAMSQFDKILFLRFFDLRLLGVYSLASNISAPVENLVYRISQSVLYPRITQAYRDDPSTFVRKYYTENTRLFLVILFLPAAVGGAAQLIIAMLYPAKFHESGAVLQAFMLRAALASLSTPIEDLMVSTGAYQVMMVGNMYRLIWMFGGSILGYYLGGFYGFTYGYSLSALPPLIYLLWLQHKKGMLMGRYDFYRAAFIVAVAVASFTASRFVFFLWPALQSRVG